MEALDVPGQLFDANKNMATLRYMRAAIYARQSLDALGTELGVERQLKECRRLCDQRGYDVAEVVQDNSVSASKRGRAGYTRLLTLIRARAVDVVVILRIDRLLRLNDELEELINLSETTGITIGTVEGDINLATPQGRLTARILVSVARNEMELKSARHKLANQQKASMGLPHHGGRRPFGYHDGGMTIKEDEAELLREMARLVINGCGFKQVAHTLNQRGERTSNGRPWLSLTVRNMLLKPRYAGLRQYGGVTYPAQWPAILDAETWTQLQLTMKMRRERSPDKPRARKYLLTGLAVCGVCGLSLTGSKVRDRPGAPERRIYHCRGQRDNGLVRGCGGVRRNADALDWWVREAVVYRLDSEELAKLLGGKDDGQLRELLKRRDALRARLDGLADDYALGVLDKPQMARATGTAQTEVRRIDSEVEGLSQATIDIPAGRSVREAWQSGDDGFRRQLLGLVIRQVVVKPSSRKPLVEIEGRVMRFDSSAVEVEWRA